MSASLENIINAIKEVALNEGFKSVEELRLNLNSNPDTLLPRLFIRLTGINYSKLRLDIAEEEYRLELIVIMPVSNNPILQLKNMTDNLLSKLIKENKLFNRLALGQKLELEETDLTNDRDIYSKFGGEGATLKLNIKNINQFGGINC